MRRVACSTAVWYLRCGSGRFHARNLRRIIEVCYLRNAKSLPLCGLLIAMSTFLFACGYAGTPPGYHPPPSGNAPTITRQPASVTVTAGQSATFSVAATGTEPLIYQWYVNSAAAGSNSSSFTIAAATAGQTGAQIYVTVTDAVGSATSATVNLTVDAAATMPTITQQPTSVTVTAGQPAHPVTAMGTAPLTYQWFMNGTAAGTNSNTFSIAQTTTAQSGAQIT